MENDIGIIHIINMIEMAIGTDDTNETIYRILKYLKGKKMNMEERLNKIEEKLNKLIEITQRYYDFWLHGTALEPIYKSFIDDLEELKSNKEQKTFK